MNFSHKLILNEILSKCSDALAIEIPVWRCVRSTNEIVMGHIDLLTFDKSNRLYVIDFKQKKEDIYKSLPQVTAYANIIKEQLNIDNLELMCITFNHEMALEFNPNSLISIIVDFINEMNEKRRNLELQPLQAQNNKDLLNEFKKFVNFINIDLI